MNKNKKDEDYSYVYKNRFLIWLMWLVPIACTGWISVVAWTVVQIMMYNSEAKERKKFKKPFRERDDIIEMNKEENLTKKEKEFLKHHPGMIKIIEFEEGTVYAYDRK